MRRPSKIDLILCSWRKTRKHLITFNSLHVISFNPEAFGQYSSRSKSRQSDRKRPFLMWTSSRMGKWNPEDLTCILKHEEYTFPSSELACSWALWARVTTIFVLYPRKKAAFLMTTIVPAKFNKANLRKDDQKHNSGRHADKQEDCWQHSWTNRLTDETEQKSILYNNVRSCKVLK